MDIAMTLVDYLNNRYGTEAIGAIAENALYYILGEKFFSFDRNDLIAQQRKKAIMLLNQNTLLKICDMFHDNNIDYVSFKGVVLSHLLYNNSTSRNAGDIDIFVNEMDFERAYQLLCERGYKLLDANDYANQHHVVLKDSSSIVELHRSIIHPDMSIDESYIRNSRATIQISEKLVNTFNLTATLLHLFYHLYMDFCLEVSVMYDFFTKKQYPKVRRFLYRAYEIALFAERYHDDICWNEFLGDLQKQKLRVRFKKMIMDIIDIFPGLFPDSLIETISQLNYVEDERDRLFKYLTDLKVYSSDSVEWLLQNYVEDSWQKHRERNICKNVGDSISLIKHSSEHEKQELSCLIDVQKKREGLVLCFNVSNDDLCITETSNYDTQASDGVHLLICGTEKYSYCSLFFFPKKEDTTIKVITYDFLNNRCINPTEHQICADFQLSEEGYTITVVFSNEFITQNHIESYFYMGLVISDCSSETHSRKNELVLSEEESLWYDPTYFAKILMKNAHVTSLVSSS